MSDHLDPAGFDFDSLAALWLNGIEQALTAVAADLQGQELFSLAFWLFYAESGSVIHVPVVSVGREQYLRDTFPDGGTIELDDVRWNPADWNYELNLPNADEIVRGYDALATWACQGVAPETARKLDHDNDGPEIAHWDAVFELGIDMVARVCRELTARAKAQQGVWGTLTLSKNFAAVICDPYQGEYKMSQWIVKCVDEPLRTRLFGELDLTPPEFMDKDTTLVEIILVALPPGGTAGLLKIKSALGLETSTAELLKAARNRPCRIAENVPHDEAATRCAPFNVDGPCLEIRRSH